MKEKKIYKSKKRRKMKEQLQYQKREIVSEETKSKCLLMAFIKILVYSIPGILL